MHSFVLQDFITIRGATTQTTINQSEHEWLDLGPYEDLIAWIDVREITTGGATNVQFNLQTAPVKDELLFVNMQASPLTATGPVTGTNMVQKILLSQNPQVPVGRWVRWQLVLNGTATAAWDAVFRILLCANSVGGAAGMGRGGMR
jgi:hypothetical protein